MEQFGALGGRAVIQAHNTYPNPVAVLSGGERNRLHLAITLKKGSKVLLLDEPTNDLDVNTLRALEEGIEDYSGCAVIISHDRLPRSHLHAHPRRSLSR